MNHALLHQMRTERDRASKKAHQYEQALLAILDDGFLTKDQLKEIEDAVTGMCTGKSWMLREKFLDEYIKKVLLS